MNAAALPRAALLDAVAPPEHRGLQRDEVRMLWTDRATGRHSHASFRDLPFILRKGDLLVVNDSATIPAAITAQRANGDTLMIHVATKIDQRVWMAEPRGDVVSGEELQLPGGGTAVTLAPVEPEHPRLWYACFGLPETMYAYLTQFGEPIRYGYLTQRFPLSDYQTVFAREPGSSEMPSAARPFSPRVLNQLHEHGIELTTITLHCGVASFESPERPSIERYTVGPKAAHAINQARNENRRVIAVGTTALRAVESAVQDGQVVASSGWTDLIIGPERGVEAIDALLSGFHPSGATHQWILRALLDSDDLSEAYNEAAQNGYFQHEFGDVHLIA
ncbi:MAG: S-adenosylmethionine:tRNA ribosyltransferase-isomerase [Candidatus Baltobacteraceae bacterium]